MVVLALKLVMVPFTRPWRGAVANCWPNGGHICVAWCEKNCVLFESGCKWQLCFGAVGAALIWQMQWLGNVELWVFKELKLSFAQCQTQE